MPPLGVCFGKRGTPQGKLATALLSNTLQHTECAAHMQEATQQPTILSAADPMAAAAFRAEAWAGEPFLRDGEDPAVVLAPGTARRRALDDATAEIEAGRSRAEPAVEGALRADARPRARARRSGAAHGGRHAAAPPPDRRARRHAHRADLGRAARRRRPRERQRPRAEDDLGDEDEDEDDVADVDAETDADAEDDEEELLGPKDDPGAVRRYRFRHPTASGKTIAAAGFVEAARTLGVLILTHRRLLVTQFTNDLTTEGYADRFTPAIEAGKEPLRNDPLTIQTYAWFARHVDSISREAYQLVICDEAHTALGEKTSAAIRSFPEPIYIGMTATEQLIAKQVSDVFPASVDDLPLQDAARRGLIAPLRCLRVPPVAAINSVPIVGGDFDQEILAKTLDHQALNQAAASLYRDRFDNTPGIVYAAGVDHAYNLAQEFRAAGIKAEAVSGRTPPVRLAETLAAYERGEINVLINAQLLAEGWNSPRATVCMHLAPTASKRVYQQRIGRIMRIHPRKEAGIVVDFVPKGATHNERVVSLHSLLDADFYREGARVTPAPRRRSQRRARRRLTPAPWLVPVTPDVRRRVAVIQREWQRVDPRFLDDDEQRYWATMAGRQIRFDERASFVQKLTEGRASKGALETFLATCAAENPNRRLRMMALQDRVSMRVERADFDDLVTLVTQAPTWEKERLAGIRILLRAIADGKPDAPDQILVRWTWKLARATRKVQDRRASTAYPEAKRLLGALANSRGHRHEENAAKLVRVALEQPIGVGVALLASAEGYTPRATKLIEEAREELGTVQEVALALSENLPAPKAQPSRSRRRRKRKKPGTDGTAPAEQNGAPQNGTPAAEGGDAATDGAAEAEAAAQAQEARGRGGACSLQRQQPRRRTATPDRGSPHPSRRPTVAPSPPVTTAGPSAASSAPSCSSRSRR